jgi:hypothetical protein
MGFFRDADDVYACIGGVFRAAIEDPDLGPRTKEAGLSMRFDFTDPESRIYADFATGTLLFGPDVPATQPSVRFSMNADDANRFWLGRLNLVMSMAKGKVRVKGSVPEMLKMLPLAKPMYARYEQLLRELGRDELIQQGD